MTSINRHVLAHGISLLLFLLAPVAVAQTSGDSARGWNPRFRSFSAAEYVITGALGAASFATFNWLEPQAEPRFTGGVLFDDAGREAFRLRSPRARDSARTWSDVGVISVLSLAVVVDSLAVPALRGRSDVAWQLAMMDAEAIAASSLLSTTLFKFIGRGRPSYADCQRDPNFDPLCRKGATASFPSGHSTMAFTAAGLSCAHHTYLSLYGNAFADGFSCGFSLALASVTSALRVLGDRHYVSDILVGDLIGFGFGFGLPRLLHYAPSSSEARVTLQNGAFPGFSIAGAF